MTDKPWTVIIPSILLSLLLGFVLLGDWDLSLFIELNKLAQLLPDSVWQFLTTLADPIVAPLLIFTLFHKDPLFIRALLMSCVVAVIVSYGLKFGFASPRPVAVLLADQFFSSGPQMRSPSFPSGHTLTIFFLMSLVSHYFKHQRMAVVWFGFALFISLSRIAVGAHWPSDILFGALLGWILGWLLVKPNRYLGDDLNPKLVLSFYFVGLFMGILSLINKTPYPAAQWFSTAVSLFAIAYSLKSITALLHRQKG